MKIRVVGKVGGDGEVWFRDVELLGAATVHERVEGNTFAVLQSNGMDYYFYEDGTFDGSGTGCSSLMQSIVGDLIPPHVEMEWTPEEIENFRKLTSQSPAPPTERLIRAMKPDEPTLTCSEVVERLRRETMGGGGWFDCAKADAILTEWVERIRKEEI